MTRLRTCHNRRRAKELKQGGLYTLQRHPRIHLLPYSVEAGPITMDDLRRTIMGQIADSMRLPPHLISSGARL